jgi:hypothetical protein
MNENNSLSMNNENQLYGQIRDMKTSRIWKPKKSAGEIEGYADGC